MVMLGTSRSQKRQDGRAFSHPFRHGRLSKGAACPAQSAPCYDSRLPENPTMTQAATLPNDLAAYWMPFTANRAFKKAPRMVVGAKDMHYVTADGRKLI